MSFNERRRFVTTNADPLSMGITTSTKRARARRFSSPVTVAIAGREQYVVIAILVAATLIRFGTLDAKSYWEDEGLTVGLLHKSFGHMLHSLHATEPDPPLYFALAWCWARVFGYGEVALRSLSALAGVLTIPIAYCAGKRLIGQRGALITAGLLAINPMLVWYSQEARGYALFVLLAALSLWCLSRALVRPGPAELALWGATCALMLATHYFAVFLIAAEAAWLLLPVARHERPAWLIGIALLTFGAVLLTVWQSHGGPARSVYWGGGSTLAFRVATVPAEFMVGLEAPHPQLFAVLAACMVLVPLALLVRNWSSLQAHVLGVRGVVVPGSIGLITLAAPLAAVVLGHDYFVPRNMIIAIVPLWMVIGAGFAVGSARLTGTLAAAGLGAISLIVLALTAWTPKYHYQDLRSVAAAMGLSSRARAVVVAPALGSDALAVYLPRGLLPVGKSPPPVSEVDVVASIWRIDGHAFDGPPPAPGANPVSPKAGFRLAQVERRSTFTLVRFVSAHPLPIDAGIARAASFVGHPATVLYEPGSR